MTEETKTADPSLLDAAVGESVAKALEVAEKRIVLVSFDTSSAMSDLQRSLAYRSPADLSHAELQAIQQYASPAGRDYAYFTDDALVQVGDLVVVAAPNGTGPAVKLPGETSSRRLTFARVSSVKPSYREGSKASQWIVGRVDTRKWLERVELAQRRELLEKKIEKTAEALRKRVEMQTLAAQHPELAELMKELDELNSTEA